MPEVKLSSSEKKELSHTSTIRCIRTGLYLLERFFMTDSKKEARKLIRKLVETCNDVLKPKLPGV